MIEINDGFTSISAGHDVIDGLSRVATGARVTVEFQREVPLAPAASVRVRYEFAGSGDWREYTGIPQPIRSVVRWGRAVVHYYRLSYWIAPSALMESGGTAALPAQSAPTDVASALSLRPSPVASAGDRSRV